LRAVTTMDIGMTIEAPAGHRAKGGSSRPRPGRWQAGRLTRMTIMVVTFLAQERRTRFEQASDVGAVGVVADAAVFGHRLMVVYERAAFFHMAREAGVIGAALDERLRIIAMDVMTGAASHLSLDDRMVRWLVQLGALFLVTGEAHFGLGSLYADLVVSSMDLVTRSTGNVAAGVQARLPVGVFAALMAAQAGLVAGINVGFGALAEGAVSLWGFVATFVVDVLFALTVTISTGWRAPIGDSAMLGLPDGEH